MLYYICLSFYIILYWCMLVHIYCIDIYWANGLQVSFLRSDELPVLRSTCVNMVLGTDMKKHFDILSRFQVLTPSRAALLTSSSPCQHARTAGTLLRQPCVVPMLPTECVHASLADPSLKPRLGQYAVQSKPSVLLASCLLGVGLTMVQCAPSLQRTVHRL